MYRWYDPGGALRPAEVADAAAELFLFGLIDPRHAAAAQSTRAVAPPLAEPGSDPVDRIRAAAARLFTTSGYHATSMREVADLAGVSKGALFYHVRKKEQLLFEIQHSVLIEGIELFNLAREEDGTAADTMIRLIGAYVHLLSHRRDEMAVLSENAKYLEPSARAEILTLQRQWSDALQHVLERGVRDGEFTDRHIGVTTRLIAGMLAATYRWFRVDGRMTPAQISEIYRAPRHLRPPTLLTVATSSGSIGGMARRVALISETSFYVGPALARVLARRGHNLVLGDPEPGLVDQLAAEGAQVEVVEGVRLHLRSASVV